MTNEEVLEDIEPKGMDPLRKSPYLKETLKEVKEWLNNTILKKN